MKFDMITAFPIPKCSSWMKLIQNVNPNLSQCLQLLPYLGLPNERVHSKMRNELINNQ